MSKFMITCALWFGMLYVNAQVKSSHDGFYSVDSVFYELKGNHSFKYCVNCYSADSLRTYTGGVWLHSRQGDANTWENGLFSKGHSSMFDNTGESHIRADVVKANTVWVRVYSDSGFTDEHHFVFLGKWRPRTPEVVSVFLDSSDFIGANGFYGPGAGTTVKAGKHWNYRANIEKACSYQVFGGKDLLLQAEQTAGVEISAKASADFPNKAIQLNANKTSYKEKVLLLGKSLTAALGDNIKVLRFLVGGSEHRSNILSNEIAADIIAPEIGGLRSTPVCLFINGSFWTYAFAEEGLGANHIAKILKTTDGQLAIIKVNKNIAVDDIKSTGATAISLGNSIYALCATNGACNLFYCYKDTVQFPVDTLDKGYNPKAFETLCTAVGGSSNALLAATIDREAFYKYALSIWFFQNGDAWGNGRVTMVKAGELPWKLFADHYYFNPGKADANDWGTYFMNYDLLNSGRSRQTLPWRATKKMLQYEPDYFCLVLEDELNTTYKEERIVSIAKKKIASLRPCITECSKAWWPNGWIDSVSWETSAAEIVSFLGERPMGIAAALPKNFMAGSDTLLTLQDMREVNIRFDNVPGKDVTVKLNSLEIKSNFSGKYYPKPDLRISVQYDPKKYEFVKWLEYPTTAASFTVSADKAITLTPVVRLRK